MNALLQYNYNSKINNKIKYLIKYLIIRMQYKYTHT